MPTNSKTNPTAGKMKTHSVTEKAAVTKAAAKTPAATGATAVAKNPTDPNMYGIVIAPGNGNPPKNHTTTTPFNMPDMAHAYPTEFISTDATKPTAQKVGKMDAMAAMVTAAEAATTAATVSKPAGSNVRDPTTVESNPKDYAIIDIDAVDDKNVHDVSSTAHVVLTAVAIKGDDHYVSHATLPQLMIYHQKHIKYHIMLYHRFYNYRIRETLIAHEFSNEDFMQREVN